MAGGIAILLLMIVLLVAGGIALALYGTGSFLWFRQIDSHADRAEHATEAPPGERKRRPRHARPTTPVQDRTDFVGGRRQARHG